MADELEPTGDERHPWLLKFTRDDGQSLRLMISESDRKRLVKILSSRSVSEPKPPMTYIVATTMQAAHEWCLENGISPKGRSVKIFTESHAIDMRGCRPRKEDAIVVLQKGPTFAGWMFMMEEVAIWEKHRGG